MAVQNIDLARIYSAGEQVKGMRQQNALAPIQMENAQLQNKLLQQKANATPSVDPEDLRRAVEWADTPEKWDQAVDVFISEGRPEFAKYKGQFHRREEIRALLASQPEPTKPLSGPGKVQADIAAGILPKGTPLTGAGTSLTVAKDGTITFNQGGAQVAPGAPLSKPVQKQVEELAFNTSEGLANLDSIAQSFDPSFLETGTRLGAAWSAGKEKLGMDISEMDRQSLTEFTTFKRNALSNLNEYIKRITGAALSEAEAVRIMAAAPNPGQGLFDGDSPTEFKAKLDSTIQELKMANARAIYASKVGLNAFDFQLNNMKDVINKRYNAEFESLTAAGMDDAAAKAKAREIIKSEFGI